MEATIDTDDDVEQHSDDLDGEVEDVETPFCMVPGWVVQWSRSLIGCAHAEGGAESQEYGGGEQDPNSGTPVARAEFFHAGLAGDDEAQADNEKGGNGEACEVSGCGELEVAVDPVGVGVEGVE